MAEYVLIHNVWLYAFPEQLDMEFVSFLLEWIESPPESDVEDHIPDDFLATVLALNLQFPDQDNNLILDGLQTRSHSKVFTEKLLLLLNREGSNYFSHYILCRSPFLCSKYVLVGKHLSNTFQFQGVEVSSSRR